MRKCTKQQWGKCESLGQAPLISLLQNSAQHTDKEFNLQKKYLIDCIEISIQLLINVYLTSFQ
jgi:hypothetical protein